MAIEPDLLLLDEPFGALDAKIRRRIRKDLKGLQQELGVTSIFVTHDQEEAFELGNQIAIMNSGAIEQIDLPRNLYDHPKTSFVAKFVGNVNVLSIPPDKNGDVAVDVMVRPEDVTIEKENGTGLQKGVGGMLASYVFLGPFIEVIIHLDNKDSIISVLPKSEFVRGGFRRGDRLKVKIDRFRTFPKE